MPLGYRKDKVRCAPVYTALAYSNFSISVKYSTRGFITYKAITQIDLLLSLPPAPAPFWRWRLATCSYFCQDGHSYPSPGANPPIDVTPAASARA